MATWKQLPVTNREGTSGGVASLVPQQMNSGTFGGPMTNYSLLHAQFVVPAGAATNDTYELIRIPSTTRVLWIQAKNETALGTVLTMDVGIARPTDAIPATTTTLFKILNATFFTTALAGATTRLVMTQIFTGSTSTLQLEPLWKTQGLAGEPAVGAPLEEYLVYLTLTTVTTPTVGTVMTFQFLVNTN